ncbi:putative ribonuclease H-like domain-containing protein [Tanacetum coccineum]|uniref:Ribonuclease H-like domain-containing protein n=1 Tax=Tanacetum coccineum TaxID=301880 RepID=A0ABQ4WGR4_9ASTR
MHRRTVLTRSGPISLNTARPISTDQSRTTVNNAGPIKNVINNAHSTARRPFNKITAANNNDFTKKVNIVKGTRVNTAGPKAVFSAVKGNKENVVKASAYYEEIDGGFVAFGGNSKGGKITGKGKIRTGRLDFEDVYFVKELKFNLLSVSQMCDKKNNVLFTDIECVVLSPDFKLTDESHVLLKVPRNDNMYNVDLKNVIPQGDLTYLFAKATPDESNLWHRRLGHVNLKTMNKLVRGNLLRGRKPSLSFMRPFGCPVTILNTIDHLGKFDGKADEGFFVGYSTNSKAFKVFNSKTRIVEENLHKPVVAGNQSNGNAGTKACDDAGKASMEIVPGKDYILLPLWLADLLFSQNSKSSLDAGFKPSGEDEKKVTEEPGKEGGDSSNDQAKDDNINSANNVNVNVVSSTVNAAGIEDNVVDENIVYGCVDDPNMPELEDIVYSDDAEDDGAEADMTNLDTHIPISPIPTTRIHKDYPVEQIIGDIHLVPQTRRMTKNLKEHGLFSSVQQRTNHKDFQNCLFACFLSQEEPKKVIQALKDPSWIEVYRNKKDERGIVIKNKARLIAYGYTQEEGIDYDEVFALVARIEAIRLFLAYASFKDLVVYQMDVKSAFLYGNIEEEVYVCQPPGFKDSDSPNRVYKVEKRGKIDKTLFIRRDKHDIRLVQVYVDDIIFGSTKKSLCTEFENMMHKKFQMSSMGELTFFLGLQVNQKEDGIFISQDNYVIEILKKVGFSDVKTINIPMETHKPLLKDADGKDVDEHLHRSTIGSLMYVTSLRPDIMFAVCACARFQVNPKVSHLHVVKRSFRYLKGQPKLGLWYPKDSPFDLVAFTDSDYAGASLDRKSTTGGCQFLGCRLISWQCKKQTVVANSITKAEYIAASNCCGHVLWIQNQMLDYGYNFMHTKIYIDNERTICIVKNPIFYSKTTHIEIIHHFIRDYNKKKLIQMIKIHTDQNVADLLTKAFDRIIHKGWLEWNVKAAKDGIGVKIGNSRVNTVGHYLELLGERPRKAKRDTKISQSSRPISLVADETVTKEREDRMKRAATTASSLKAEQDSGNINRTQSMATLNEPSPHGTGSGSGPRCQDTILGDAEAQTRVLDLETTKTAQAKEIASLKKKVKKLERKRKLKTPGMNLFKIGTSRKRSLGEEDASKQGRNLKQGKQRSIFKESDFDDEGFDADMDEVFKDVEGDAEQVISAAVDEVSTGDAVKTVGTEVNTANAPVTTAGVSVSTAEPITPPTTTTIFEDENRTIA